MNLSLRVLLGYFVIVGVAAFFVLQIFVNQVSPSVREAIEDTMVDTANLLAVVVTEDMRNGRIKNGDFSKHLDEYRQRSIDVNIWGFRKTSVDYRILITDDKGIVQLDSSHVAEGLDYSRWLDVSRTLRGEYGARTTRSDPDDGTSTVFYVAAPIVSHNKIIGVLTVAKPIRKVEPIIASSERNIVRQGFWLMGVAMLVGILVSLWLRFSINRLRQYAMDVTEGKPAIPPMGGGKELRDLAMAVEGMRQKLEGKQYIEYYIQALTHELKSPLAALRAASEILQEPHLSEANRQKFSKHVLEQGMRLHGTVDSMLALSQLEAANAPRKQEKIDLSLIIQCVIASRTAHAESRNIHIIYNNTAQKSILNGDAEQLTLALGNLLENALNHSNEQSKVEVTLSSQAHQLSVTVRDHGSGIPDYAQQRVFERFYSLPQPSGGKGSGLGLSIVQEVAKLHGGRATLTNAEGGGAIATLLFPL